MKHLLVLILALVWPALAFATQDRWPALFDVTGVADDDVLNIRAAADADAPLVGSLRFDQTDIEVIRPNPRHSWGLVNTGEGTGWVSLAYLRRQPGQWLGSIPQGARCGGNEPFWSFSYAPDRSAEFGLPDRKLYGNLLDAIPSENRRDAYALTVRFGPGQDGVGVFRLNACSDGMSDRAYGMTLDLVLGDMNGARVLSGCCSLTSP